jgi:hypothetical protein
MLIYVNKVTNFLMSLVPTHTSLVLTQILIYRYVDHTKCSSERKKGDQNNESSHMAMLYMITLHVNLFFLDVWQ